MRRRPAITIVFALLGLCILVSLGMWQLQRHAWKQDLLAEIAGRIAADPVALPAAPDPARHAYLPVRVEGRIGAAEILVQSSLRRAGAGYRVIAPFETGDGRRILIDRGFVPHAGRDAARGTGAAVVTGNLHWPDEVDMFTPAPDREAGLWFARDVPALAEALGTEPVLVVVRESEPAPGGIIRLPVDTAGIPDNHLGYAVQWFAMAAVWVAMALGFLVSQHRRERKGSAR